MTRRAPVLRARAPRAVAAEQRVSISRVHVHVHVHVLVLVLIRRLIRLSLYFYGSGIVEDAASGEVLFRVLRIRRIGAGTSQRNLRDDVGRVRIGRILPAVIVVDDRGGRHHRVFGVQLHGSAAGAPAR